MTEKKETTKKADSKKYFEGIGRRKKAVARVRIFSCPPFEEGEGKITVNDLPYKDFFKTAEMQSIIEDALKKMKSLNRFIVTVKVNGGGVRGQAEAIRHSLSRALIDFNPDFRKKLKRSGYLRRDPRMKERKKAGLRKARRAPQWSKR